MMYGGIEEETQDVSASDNEHERNTFFMRDKLLWIVGKFNCLGIVMRDSNEEFPVLYKNSSNVSM